MGHGLAGVAKQPHDMCSFNSLHDRTARPLGFHFSWSCGQVFFTLPMCFTTAYVQNPVLPTISIHFCLCSVSNAVYAQAQRGCYFEAPRLSGVLHSHRSCSSLA